MTLIMRRRRVSRRGVFRAEQEPLELLAFLILLRAASMPPARKNRRRSRSRRRRPSPTISPAFRDIGPYRGGRATAVTGVRGQPLTFYFGGTRGGVWKTTDGGSNWEPMSDKDFKTGSVVYRGLRIRPERRVRRHGRVADPRERLQRRRRLQVDLFSATPGRTWG